jgi:hypothetical protein
MRIFKFSSNYFENISDLSFSSIEYSKFKYGSKRVASDFGKELGTSFLLSEEHQFLLNNIDNKKLIISSAPYKFIPTASNMLKDYFYAEFNNIWSLKNITAIDLKVFREHSYNDDYGSLNADLRKLAINSDDFHIDKFIILGNTIIFIDDIRITGSHENRIISLLEKNDFDGDVYFLYFAELNNPQKINPNIENELNYSFVKNIFDIDYIIKKDDFIFNTRAIKFILKSNPNDFILFINSQTKLFQKSLLTNLQGNDYHKIDEFKENFNYLLSVLL